MPPNFTHDSSDAPTRRIFDEVDRWEVPQQRSRAEAWRELQARIEDVQPAAAPVRPLFRQLRFWVAAAAAVLLLGSFTFVLLPDRASFTAPAGETLLTALPDGSTARLNAGSELYYRGGGLSSSRTVTLSGEAFFQVVPGEEFEVITAQGVVKVIGTSFNVSAYGDELQVACIEGKVAVKFDGESRQLSAGEAIQNTGEQSALPYSFDKKQVLGWQQGNFYFDDAPLNTVIAVLARQYNLEVQSPRFTERRYTGFFTNKDLKGALRLVFEPMGISYQLKDNRLVILPK